MEHSLFTLISTLGRRPGANFFNIAIGGAQVSPIDIRLQIFTADRARRHPFDLRAILGRHTAAPQPVVNDLLHHTDLASQFSLATDHRNCASEMFHLAQIKHVGIICQHVVFAPGGICLRLPSWL